MYTPFFRQGPPPLSCFLSCSLSCLKTWNFPYMPVLYLPVRHTLPDNTAARKGGLTRFSPRWKVCYSASNASPKAFLPSPNHRSVSPFCSAKKKNQDKTICLQIVFTPPTLLFAPYFSPLHMRLFSSVSDLLHAAPAESHPPYRTFHVHSKKAAHDKSPFLHVFSCILARSCACSHPLFPVFVRSMTHKIPVFRIYSPHFRLHKQGFRSKKSSPNSERNNPLEEFHISKIFIIFAEDRLHSAKWKQAFFALICTIFAENKVALGKTTGYNEASFFCPSC